MGVGTINPYLLEMLGRSPRRLKVIQNTLASRQSQATLFWAFNYGILNWLGANRHISENQLADDINTLVSDGLVIKNDTEVSLTKKGIRKQEEVLSKYYQPLFSNWTWLTNPEKFAPRFLLAIQAVSQLAHNSNRYQPLSLSNSEMWRVHNWLKNSSPNLIKTTYQEIISIAQYLSKSDDRLAVLFANELLGWHTPGWTFNEAKSLLKVTKLEVVLMDRDVWLGVAAYLNQKHGALFNLMRDLMAQSPLSDSCLRTLQMFAQGNDLSQIAQVRHLKISTIREHILEAAIITPRYVEWNRLFNTGDLKQLAVLYSGNPLIWNFKRMTKNKENDFFKFRLFQIKTIQEMKNAE